MFLLGQVPRNLISDNGAGGYHASLSRTAATAGSRFTLYNPPAPAGPPLVLITGVQFYGQSEGAQLDFGRSVDITELDLLSQDLDETTSVANLFGQALDTDSVVSVLTSAGFGPTILGSFWQEVSDTDSNKNIACNLEFPLVLPPGNALIVSTSNASSSRVDRLSFRWFRL